MHFLYQHIPTILDMNIKNPPACRILSVCLADVPAFMLRLIFEHVPLTRILATSDFTRFLPCHI